MHRACHAIFHISVFYAPGRRRSEHARRFRDRGDTRGRRFLPLVRQEGARREEPGAGSEEEDLMQSGWADACVSSRVVVE